mmetsp:Transcript_36016/g.41742  ORF Transcript_36016/g.41742 Transcript_36016/m.41742 type:complete len:453 (+) Transcript_36016:485-1843(+)
MATATQLQGPHPPGPPPPPPPSGPPPPPRSRQLHPPRRPPAGSRPSAPSRRASGPPPPPSGAPPPPPHASRKRPPQNYGNTVANKRSSLSRMKPPTDLRDVKVFLKKAQIGQGSYGSVFMGEDTQNSKEIVALKRINAAQEENGFPITSIREIKILKALNHPNIVILKEMVTSKEKEGIPKSVFMVFEYLEYDLTGILETREIRMSQDHIKSWSHQLLKGVHYMHTNKVIHRDLKASNLLISKSGRLKIADWGLARSWNDQMKRLTNRVITLWYRPPELLLGCTAYSPKIDMWSVGCIIAEMFRRSGFLRGQTEAEQLKLIFEKCGHPTPGDWPAIHDMCPEWKKHEPLIVERNPRRIRDSLRENVTNSLWMTDHALDLMDNLMILNPGKRSSALDALKADYFYENPIVKKPEDLNMKFGVDSVHEWEARKKQEEIRRRHQQQMAQRRGVAP